MTAAVRVNPYAPIDDGFRRMVSVSLAIHLAAVALYLFLPRSWFEKPAPILMTISLGGGIGEKTTGMTPIAGREVEKVAPPPKRPEPVKPTPPQKTNTMAVPTKVTPPPKETKAVEKTPPPVDTRPPTTGSEVRTGTASAETGARGQSAGLQVGGGAGASTMLPADFCCMEYAKRFIEQIDRHWDRRVTTTGEVTVTFTIQRDGTLTAESVTKSSGQPELDVRSLSAVRRTKKIDPLPPQYTNPTLTIHLVFPYVK